MKCTWGYLQEERETFQSLEILADFQWKKLGLPQQAVYVEKEQRKKKKSNSSAKQEVCWDLNSSHNFSLMSVAWDWVFPFLGLSPTIQK